LIGGEQLTEAKMEESLQSHIGATCKGMCWVGSSRLIHSSDITGYVYCWCWWYLGPVPIHYTHTHTHTHTVSLSVITFVGISSAHSIPIFF